MSAADNLFSHFFELCPETLSDCCRNDDFGDDSKGDVSGVVPVF